MSNKHDRSGRGRKPRGETQVARPEVEAPETVADVAAQAAPTLIERAAAGMTASAEVLAIEVAAPAEIELTPAQAREPAPINIANPGAPTAPFKESTPMVNETIQNIGQQSADQVRAASEQFRGAAESTMHTMQGQTSQAMERNTRLMSEMGDLARGNMEAAVQSSRIAAEGVQAIGREAVEFGRKSFEGFSSTVKQLAEAKTPADVLRLQGEWARQSFDMAVSAGAQMSERMVKLAGESTQPLQNRVAVATQKMQGATA